MFNLCMQLFIYFVRSYIHMKERWLLMTVRVGMGQKEPEGKMVLN